MSRETVSEDLFMAPKKRTVWVNFWRGVYEELAQGFPSQEEADAQHYADGRIGGKAYPVEIEE